MARRLAELGLTPGVCLRVVQDAGGPLLLSVRNSRVAVGRGIADKLQVELIHEGEQRDDEFAGSDTGTTVTEKPAATPSAGGQLGRQGRWSHLGRRRRRHEEAGSHSHWSQG